MGNFWDIRGVWAGTVVCGNHASLDILLSVKDSNPSCALMTTLMFITSLVLFSLIWKYIFIVQMWSSKTGEQRHKYTGSPTLCLICYYLLRISHPFFILMQSSILGHFMCLWVYVQMLTHYNSLLCLCFSSCGASQRSSSQLYNSPLCGFSKINPMGFLLEGVK